MLAGKLFLKLVRTGSAAEIIGLPPNIFRYRCSSWNKHQADRILNHVIFARRETVRLVSAFELSNGTTEDKIQDDKQPENENNSIHSGGLFLIPQSYGHSTTTVKDSLIYSG